MMPPGDLLELIEKRETLEGVDAKGMVAMALTEIIDIASGALREELVNRREWTTRMVADAGRRIARLQAVLDKPATS